jgi:hypothetical protein
MKRVIISTAKPGFRGRLLTDAACSAFGWRPARADRSFPPPPLPPPILSFVARSTCAGFFDPIRAA